MWVIESWFAIVRGEDKLYQLASAQACGLAVPETLCSTREEELGQFLAVPTERIAKPLSVGIIPAPRSGGRMIQMMTNRVEDDDRSNVAAFQAAPTLLQANIVKSWECRVFATKLSHVAYRAAEPLSEGGKIDWRRDIRRLEWTGTDVPHEVLSCARSYLQRTGLGYGVFDFIVDDRGRWVFLECNPDGQWAWIDTDSTTGVPVAMSILLASLLEEA